MGCLVCLVLNNALRGQRGIYGVINGSVHGHTWLNKVLTQGRSQGVGLESTIVRAWTSVDSCVLLEQTVRFCWRSWERPTAGGCVVCHVQECAVGVCVGG